MIYTKDQKTRWAWTGNEFGYPIGKTVFDSNYIKSPAYFREKWGNDWQATYPTLYTTYISRRAEWVRPGYDYSYPFYLWRQNDNKISLYNHGVQENCGLIMYDDDYFYWCPSDDVFSTEGTLDQQVRYHDTSLLSVSSTWHSTVGLIAASDTSKKINLPAALTTYHLRGSSDVTLPYISYQYPIVTDLQNPDIEILCMHDYRSSNNDDQNGAFDPSYIRDVLNNSPTLQHSVNIKKQRTSELPYVYLCSGVFEPKNYSSRLQKKYSIVSVPVIRIGRKNLPKEFYIGLCSANVTIEVQG